MNQVNLIFDPPAPGDSLGLQRGFQTLAVVLPGLKRDNIAIVLPFFADGAKRDRIRRTIAVQPADQPSAADWARRPGYVGAAPT